MIWIWLIDKALKNTKRGFPVMFSIFTLFPIMVPDFYLSLSLDCRSFLGRQLTQGCIFTLSIAC
ncbi:hypothetical protein RYX45_25040, partial [Alkalihalophilus pseudofirmus]